MIKQPPQILKFFSSYLEVERDWNRRLKGSPGTHVVTEDRLFLPPFQIKFDWRGSDVDDFFHHIYLINYDTGTSNDITGDIRAWGVFNYSTFQNLILYRFPLWEMADPGNYYLRISDGTPGGTGVVEIWYSEVFKLCDLNRNLLTEFTGSAGWNTFQVSDYISTRDVYSFRICESGGSANDVDSNYFYVIKDEPLDFYIYGYTSSINCGVTTFLPLQFSLLDAADNVISELIDVGLGAFHFRLIPTKTTVVRLRGQNLSLNGRSEWFAYLHYANPQLNPGVTDAFSTEDENIGLRKVLRWSHSKNICDIIYDELTGYNHNDHPWTLSYENYLILDAVKDDQNYGPPLVPQFEIEETVKEDDVFNKYQIVGVQKEWYALSLAASANLSKAIQYIHLHDTVELGLDGEVWILTENRSELSTANDYNILVKFIFREDTCPVDSCGFAVECCGNFDNVLDYESGGVVALPACSTEGVRYLVRVDPPGKQWVYECIDGTWTLQGGAEMTKGACIFNEGGDPLTECCYWYYNVSETSYYKFVDINTVTDMTGGIARINISNYGKEGLVVIAQVDGVDSGQPKILTGAASDILYVYCGAGTFDFTIRILGCGGISDTVSQTITA